MATATNSKITTLTSPTPSILSKGGLPPTLLPIQYRTFERIYAIKAKEAGGLTIKITTLSQEYFTKLPILMRELSSEIIGQESSTLLHNALLQRTPEPILQILLHHGLLPAKSLPDLKRALFYEPATVGEVRLAEELAAEAAKAGGNQDGGRAAAASGRAREAWSAMGASVFSSAPAVGPAGSTPSGSPASAPAGTKALSNLLESVMEREELALVENISHDEESLSCPLTLRTFKEPVKDSHGHLFEREAIAHYAKTHNGICPLNHTPLGELTSDTQTRDKVHAMLDEIRPGDHIVPTFAIFEKDDSHAAEKNFIQARDLLDRGQYEKAIEVYREVFRHSKDWRDYRDLVELYEKKQLPGYAYLASLYLTLYQLQAGDYRFAARALDKALEKRYPQRSTEQKPNELLMRGVLAVLHALAGNEEGAQEELTSASRSPEEKERLLLLYQGLLAEDPHIYTAYPLLVSLLDSLKGEEKARVLLKGSLHALQGEKLDIAERFFNEAKALLATENKESLTLLDHQIGLELQGLLKEGREKELRERSLEDFLRSTSGGEEEELSRFAASGGVLPLKKELQEMKDKLGEEVKELQKTAREEVLPLKGELKELKQVVAEGEKKNQEVLSALVTKEEFGGLQLAVREVERKQLEEERMRIFGDSLFVAADWNRYIGDVGEEPPLPADIESILSGPCPFFPGKTVKESRILVLVPQTVNGRPFTLDSLMEDLTQASKEGSGGHTTKYDIYWDKAQAELGPKPAPASHWVLFTRDVIPGTRRKIFIDQQSLLNTKKGALPYEVPTTLDVTTAIVMHYVKTGKKLYPDHLGPDGWTFTRCIEEVSGYRIACGGFGGGVRVNPYHDPDFAAGILGLGGCRKF